LPVRWLARFQYNTLESLQSVTCPVFIAHSAEDEIVPFEQSQQLFKAAQEPKQFLFLAGGHNTGFIFKQPDWIKSLGVFMDGHLSASR